MLAMHSFIAVCQLYAINMSDLIHVQVISKYNTYIRIAKLPYKPMGTILVRK